MELKNIIIVVLLISAVVLGISTYLGEISTNYEQSIDYSDLNKTSLERMRNSTKLTDELKSEIGNMTMRSGLTIVYLPYDMIKVGWTSIKLTFNSFSIVVNIFEDGMNILANVLRIPVWIIGIIISIITIIIIFVIVELFLKWRSG